MYSSGVTTSTAITGSKRTGPALRAASLTAIEPAIRKASSEESTSWYEPSVQDDPHIHGGIARDDAARSSASLMPCVDCGNVLLAE